MPEKQATGNEDTGAAETVTESEQQQSQTTEVLMMSQAPAVTDVQRSRTYNKLGGSTVTIHIHYFYVNVF